jgi:hypothetical protein
MNKSQVVRFAAFVTVLAVLLGYVVYHRAQAPASLLTPTVSHRGSAHASTTQLENYFVNFRMRRDRLMSQEIATLKSLVNNPAISQSAKNEAALTMVRDTQELKQAMRIEGILSGRGFPLSAATVTRNQVVVVVGAARLSNQQVAKIADTVTSVTGLPPQDVVILPKT